MISWYIASRSAWVLISTVQAEVGARVFQGLDQGVDLRRRRVEVGRHPAGGLDTEPRVGRLGAVVTGSDRDAARVDDLRDVVRVDALQLERDGATTHRRVPRTEDREPLDRLQPLEGVARDRLLMGVDRVHAQVAE